MPPELKDLTSAIRLVSADASGGVTEGHLGEVTEGAGRGEF